MKTISLPPRAHTLISATRHIGYSLASAIADLIDNSIAAEARNIDIDFIDSAESYIAIIDDGFGMSEDELMNAMQYGSSDPSSNRSENDLGRYGLGLKTASMSQCTKMTVVSKKNGKMAAQRWDLDYIRSHKDEVWPLIKLTENEIEKLPLVGTLSSRVSGTLIVWQNIDFGGSYDETTFDDEMHKAMEHLSLVFHRYLYGEDGIRKLNIRVNGRILTPKDPFLQHVQGEKHGHQCKATQSLGSGKNKITLQAFVLPHEKELTDEMRRLLGADKLLRRTQGFYIYRNKRLITYGNWHGLRAQGEFFKLARVKVDIPNSLDLEWSLDVKKSVAIPPKKIVAHLKAYVDSVVRQSVNAIRVQVFGRKPRLDRPDIHPWDTRVADGVVTSVQINRNHPVVRAVLESGAVAEKLLVMLERTLPIDTIYYSRSNERKLDNEMPFSEDELVDMLEGLISTIPKGMARKNAFRTFLVSDPFAMCADKLAKREEEVLNATV